jgi:hypothetical protein
VVSIIETEICNAENPSNAITVFTNEYIQITRILVYSKTLRKVIAF